MLVLHSQGGEYITDQLCVRAPSTPECDREDECARQRAAALQMTSPTHHRERAAAAAAASRSRNQPPQKKEKSNQRSNKSVEQGLNLSRS